MFIELKITAENTQEFDVLMARFAPSAVTTCEPEARGSVAVEAEATLDPAPKQTRQRKAKDEPSPEAPAVAEPEASVAAEPEAPEVHPMLATRTMAEVMTLGGKKVTEVGANVVLSMLKDRFEVLSFKQLKDEDLNEAYAAMEDLK